MGATTLEDLRAELGDAIARGDRPEAVRLALEAVDDGSVSIEQIHVILGDLLTDIGNGWRTGATAIWQEHLASAATRTVIEALYPTVRRLAPLPNGHTVVLGCPEDESHDLGLRMLADRFELAGWRVCYLGADVPAAEIARAALSSGAELIVLSASTHYHLVRLRSAMETLASDLPNVRVLVGGPALCGTVPDALVGHLFDPNEFFSDVSGLAPACEED